MPTAASPKAYTIELFKTAYSTGRTKIYEEIKSGRLVAHKVGNKTLILEPDAERWARSLPKLSTAIAEGAQ